MDIKKKLTSFVLVFVMISCCYITAFAEDYAEIVEYNDVADPVHDFNYYAYDIAGAIDSGRYYRSDNAYFKDEADVFASDLVCEEIFGEIQKTADEIDMNVAIFIGGLYRDDPTTKNFASQSSEYVFGKEDGINSVFLYLDFEGQSPSYDYIDTFHDAQLYYTNSTLFDRIQDMIDDMYEYLPESGETVYKDDVQDAIWVFLDDLVSFKKEGLVHNAYYHNDETGMYRYVFFGNIIDSPIRPYRYLILFLIIGAILGLIVGSVRGVSIRKKYKFRQGQNVSAYTSNNRINFVDVQDIFIGEHTTKHHIESSSGGSGGGGGGGGGGSHGGGGGHR